MIARTGPTKFAHAMNGLLWRAIYFFGQDWMKATILPRMATGELMVANCLTEPEAGTGKDIGYPLLRDQGNSAYLRDTGDPTTSEGGQIEWGYYEEKDPRMVHPRDLLEKEECRLSPSQRDLERPAGIRSPLVAPALLRGGASEAVLAAEANVPYASIALVTDYDAGVDGHEPVTMESVLEVMRSNIEHLRDVLSRLVPALEA